MRAESFSFMRPQRSREHRCAGDLCMEMPAIDCNSTNALVMEAFSSQKEMACLAVVEDARPIGLINRTIFLSMMSKPFHRELYDKKSCIAFMDKEPLIVDADMSIEALTFKTVESGEKALSDGFIVTRDGRFAGLGSGLQLMAVVAAMQAEKNRQIMQSIGIHSRRPWKTPSCCGNHGMSSAATSTISAPTPMAGSAQSPTAR